ncbi:hypothetical protein GLYMA_12G025451v4 [Glycine max]|nr:hypothetical protein GLYMA_12G025451v4 [Glycine max]KAH1141259.1 hypothetical protein GYH30_032492 [Glycine max]
MFGWIIIHFVAFLRNLWELTQCLCVNYNRRVSAS